VKAGGFSFYTETRVRYEFEPYPTEIEDRKSQFPLEIYVEKIYDYNKFRRSGSGTIFETGIAYKQNLSNGRK